MEQTQEKINKTQQELIKHSVLIIREMFTDIARYNLEYQPDKNTYHDVLGKLQGENLEKAVKQLIEKDILKDSGSTCYDLSHLFSNQEISGTIKKVFEDCEIDNMDVLLKYLPAGVKANIEQSGEQGYVTKMSIEHDSKEYSYKIDANKKDWELDIEKILAGSMSIDKSKMFAQNSSTYNLIKSLFAKLFKLNLEQEINGYSLNELMDKGIPGFEMGIVGSFTIEDMLEEIAKKRKLESDSKQEARFIFCEGIRAYASKYNEQILNATISYELCRGFEDGYSTLKFTSPTQEALICKDVNNEDSVNNFLNNVPSTQSVNRQTNQTGPILTRNNQE